MSWRLLLLAAVVLVFLAIVAALRRGRDAKRRERASVVTPKLLFNYVRSSLSQQQQQRQQSMVVHQVYDFGARAIVLLRSTADATLIVGTFPLPDPRRYHVRFSSTSRLNERYVAAVAAGGALRLEHLVDIADRRSLMRRGGDIDRPLSDPLRAWGGKRLRVLATVDGRIFLRFDRSSRTIQLRAPTGVRVEVVSRRRRSGGGDDDGSAVVRFVTKTPCSNGTDDVRYGDFLSKYAGRRATFMRRNEYDRIVPFMRWICKSADDERPILTLRDD